MNKTVIFTLITSVSILIAACSSATDSNTANNSTNPTLTANPPANVENPTTTGNIPLQNTENMKEVAPGIPVPANANVQVVKPDMSKNTKPAGELKVQAPDNSEVASRLDEKGAVSVRTFKNHPTIAKVEQIMTSTEDQKITIFLKNGQSKVVPYNKDLNVMMISGDEIAKLAGVAPKNAPAPPASKDETKKVDEAKPANVAKDDTVKNP